jgi:hypothetical protein
MLNNVYARIHWRGWGIAVLFYFLAAWLGAAMLVRACYGIEFLRRVHPQVFSSALTIAGAASLATGLWVNRGLPRDGERCHSFMDLAMEWWGVALLVGGAVVFFTYDAPLEWDPFRIIGVCIAIAGVSSVAVGLLLNRGFPRPAGAWRGLLPNLPMEVWGAALFAGGAILFLAQGPATPWRRADQPPQTGRIVITRSR